MVNASERYKLECRHPAPANATAVLAKAAAGLLVIIGIAAIGLTSLPPSELARIEPGSQQSGEARDIVVAGMVDVRPASRTDLQPTDSVSAATPIVR
jgi:hypothetical protein